MASLFTPTRQNGHHVTRSPTVPGHKGRSCHLANLATLNVPARRRDPKICGPRTRPMESEKALTRSRSGPSFVELPGIEPGSDIGLSCANAGIGYAKRRGSTRYDLRIRQKC